MMRLTNQNKIFQRAIIQMFEYKYEIPFALDEYLIG